MAIPSTDEPIRSVTGAALPAIARKAQEIVRDEKGRFVPGISGNPNGNPPGYKHLSTQLLQMMFEKPEGEEDTHGTLLNKKVIRKAIVDGDMRAIELIYERVEGKVEQKTDITTGGEKLTGQNQSLAKAALQKYLDGTQGDTSIERPQ